MKNYQSALEPGMAGKWNYSFQSTDSRDFHMLKIAKSILQQIAYPRRGTGEEELTIQKVADYIQQEFSLEELDS